MDTSRRKKYPYGRLEQWRIRSKHIDRNTGIHQYNMQSTRLLRCSYQISIIKRLPHQRHLLFSSSWDIPGRILILWKNCGIPLGPVDWYKWKYITRFLATWHHTYIGTKLHLADASIMNKFNEKIHTSLVKKDIYQKIHYIHKQYIYPLPTHLVRAF